MDGTLLSWVRGPGSALAPGPAAELIAALAEAAALSAGLPWSCLGVAHAACYLAGVDVPWQAVDRRGAPAVGVVCGAGLKRVARSAEAPWEFPVNGFEVQRRHSTEPHA